MKGWCFWILPNPHCFQWCFLGQLLGTNNLKWPNLGGGFNLFIAPLQSRVRFPYLYILIKLDWTHLVTAWHWILAFFGGLFFFNKHRRWSSSKSLSFSSPLAKWCAGDLWRCDTSWCSSSVKINLPDEVSRWYVEITLLLPESSPVHPWKTVVGRWSSPTFWDGYHGNYSGASCSLNFGDVTFSTKPPGWVWEWVMSSLVRPAVDLACRQRVGSTVTFWRASVFLCQCFFGQFFWKKIDENIRMASQELVVL